MVWGVFPQGKICKKQKAKVGPVRKPWQRWEGDGGSRDAGNKRAAPGSAFPSAWTNSPVGSRVQAQWGRLEASRAKAAGFSPLALFFIKIGLC